MMQQAHLGSAYAYYFGRAHHGTIRGLANTVFIGGTAIGPAVLAMGPDFMGASRQSCGSVRRFRSCWPSPRSWGGRRSRREE